jgi:hypothetical protein
MPRVTRAQLLDCACQGIGDCEACQLEALETGIETAMMQEEEEEELDSDTWGAFQQD